MNQKGAGLIGLLLVAAIIALLVYGGSYFWQKDEKTGQSNIKEIKQDLKKIQAQNEEINKRNQEALDDLDSKATSTK